MLCFNHAISRMLCAGALLLLNMLAAVQDSAASTDAPSSCLQLAQLARSRYITLPITQPAFFAGTSMRKCSRPSEGPLSLPPLSCSSSRSNRIRL